jgi:hypothetical protein
MRSPEIARVLRPRGIYLGTNVNKWALDGFHLSQLRRLASRLTGASLRYHVEFEMPSSPAEKLKQAGFSNVVGGTERWLPTANPAQALSVAHTQSRNIRCRMKNGFPIAVTFSRSQPT